MYSIVLTDGKNINIKATKVEWDEKDRIAMFFNDEKMIAGFNIDNVVGWIDAEHKAEGYICKVKYDARISGRKRK